MNKYEFELFDKIISLEDYAKLLIGKNQLDVKNLTTALEILFDEAVSQGVKQKRLRKWKNKNLKNK